MITFLNRTENPTEKYGLEYSEFDFVFGDVLKSLLRIIDEKCASTNAKAVSLAFEFNTFTVVWRKNVVKYVNVNQYLFLYQR